MIKLKTPLRNEDIKKLKAGDRVLLSGIIYAARDAAHKRMQKVLEKIKRLPFDVKGQIIYYAGPTPKRPGGIIGSAGPTTSCRMDAYTLKLLAKGLKATIGKGPRGKEIVKALKRHRAVYFAATGGAAALISGCIIKADVIAYGELGAEAIHRLEVRDFPLIVAIDSRGKSLFKA